MKKYIHTKNIRLNLSLDIDWANDLKAPDISQTF